MGCGGSKSSVEDSIHALPQKSPVVNAKVYQPKEAGGGEKNTIIKLPEIETSELKDSEIQGKVLPKEKDVKQENIVQEIKEFTKDENDLKVPIQELISANKEELDPQILYYFDFKTKRFHYCDVTRGMGTLDWLSMKLKEDSNHQLPFFQRNYTLSDSEQFSYCKIPGPRILILGGFNPLYSCIEFNYELNSFTVRGFNAQSRIRPSVVEFGGVVALVSGSLGDTYSTSADIYDYKIDKWVTLPSTETPHYNGACYTMAKDGVAQIKDYKDRILYIAGGLTSIEAINNFNLTIEAFDFTSFKWTTIKIETQFNVLKVPRIVGCGIIKIDENSVLLLNEHGTRSCYINKNNKELLKVGRLLNKEELCLKGMPLQGLIYKRRAYLLSHEHSDNEKAVTHVGDIKNSHWIKESGSIVNWDN